MGSVDVTLLGDVKSGKIVCLEAGQKFVDLLLSLLAQPLGSILKLLFDEEGSENVPVKMGIFNLYKSVNRLDSTLFNIQKGDLLNPPRITVPVTSGTSALISFACQGCQAGGYCAIHPQRPAGQLVSGVSKATITFVLTNELELFQSTCLSFFSLIRDCKGVSDLVRVDTTVDSRKALTLIKASFNGVQYLMMFLEPHLLLPASPKSPAHA